jgi:Tol biopolymer transport system component
MSNAGRRITALLGASALLASVVATAHAATLFDPALKFRRLPTQHFVIYYHQGEERIAQRLAVVAEEIWRTIEAPLRITLPRLTHVVIADQTELANGYATPLPYDTIVLYAVTPSGAEFDFDDWLRLTFAHEFTHIVHLDRSEGWARPVRWVFGRAPIAFPNLFLPNWQIEGLATYEESIITGEGRLHAGDVRAIVGEAARARDLEPLDRVNGGLTDWPGGSTVYAYGVGFHEYLADRFGAEKLAALADATARRLPYLGSRAFLSVYGESLGSLWRDYQEQQMAAYPASSADANLTQLTHRGFVVTGPRFDRFGGGVIYSEVDPRGFPSLYRVEFDGSGPQPITDRYLGSTVAVGSTDVYFDQMELRRNVALYSDLYAWSRASGSVRPLSREARLFDPDLSPDGQTLVCVQNVTGHRSLMLVRVGFGTNADPIPSSALTTLLSEADTQFNAPKWSPDGRTIAVERQRLGAMPEIVLVDVSTKMARVLASAPDTRFATPAWRPDGNAVVAAMAPGDDTFNLVEIDIHDSTLRQLTHTTGGATWPDVAADGSTIVFVGYTTAGYDLFTMPYPSSTASTPRTLTLQNHLAGQDEDSTTGATLDYSPWPTLKPTSWSPVIDAANGTEQIRVGAAFAGADILGYHSYSVSATWLVSAPAGAIQPSAAIPDWQAEYVYSRWRPSLYVAASSATSFFAGVASDLVTPADVTRRTRQIETGILFPFLHIRVQQSVLVSIGRAFDDYTLATSSFIRDRTPLRAAWQINTSRSYGYSISREDGVSLGATGEWVRQALGSFADATTVTADARAYLPGFGRQQVVAIRLAGGGLSGEPIAGRTFLMGGDYPGAGSVDFDSRAISLMRGFPDASFAGTHVALLNAEYRFPIARPQRGVGTWPVFLHTIHAAIVSDVGETWTRAFSNDAIKVSAGAEVSADIIAGYSLPFTITAGAAWGHDVSGIRADGVTGYFRVGKAF